MEDDLARYRRSLENLEKALVSVGSLCGLASGLSFGDSWQVIHELRRLGAEIGRFRLLTDYWLRERPELFSYEPMTKLFDDFDKLQIARRIAEIEAEAYEDDLVAQKDKLASLEAEVAAWSKEYERNSPFELAMRPLLTASKPTSADTP